MLSSQKTSSPKQQVADNKRTVLDISSCIPKDERSRKWKALVHYEMTYPDAMDDCSWIHLLYTSDGGYDKIVQLLVDRWRVDPNMRDRCELTPLCNAAKSSSNKLLQLLHDTVKVNHNVKD